MQKKSPISTMIVIFCTTIQQIFVHVDPVFYTAISKHNVFAVIPRNHVKKHILTAA